MFKAHLECCSSVQFNYAIHVPDGWFSLSEYIQMDSIRSFCGRFRFVCLSHVFNYLERAIYHLSNYVVESHNYLPEVRWRRSVVAVLFDRKSWNERIKINNYGCNWRKWLMCDNISNRNSQRLCFVSLRSISKYWTIFQLCQSCVWVIKLKSLIAFMT